MKEIVLYLFAICVLQVWPSGGEN